MHDTQQYHILPLIYASIYYCLFSSTLSHVYLHLNLHILTNTYMNWLYHLHYTTYIHTYIGILIREPSGRWSYNHNTGHQLHAFLDSLSYTIPCERVLKERIIERLYFVKRRLFLSHVKLQQAQLEWIIRYVLYYI